MANKSRPVRLLPLFAIALAGGALFAGTAVYVRQAPKVHPRPPAKTQQAASPKVERPQKTIEVLEPSYNDKGDLVLEPRVQALPPGTDGMVAALNAYLRKVPAVPSAARVRSVRVERRVATVDFSAEFDAGYGTEDERTIVEGVLTTMGQFPGVDTVRFLINGEETQGIGNIDLSTPQPVHRSGGGKP
jgi:hypothetical protein